MADTSPPQQTLGDLHAQATAPWDRYVEFAASRGHPTTITEMVLSGLNAFTSSLEIIAENTGGSTELQQKLQAEWRHFANGPAILEAFRRQAFRRLNRGNWIAIGYRVYANGRRELNYVWDGRFSADSFDWQRARYSSKQRRYDEIRIIDREQCSAEWLWKFDRKRAGELGRPAIGEIDAAIARAASSFPWFWEKRFHKRAVFEVHRALEQIGNSDISYSESTVDKAVRRLRRNLAK